MFAGYVPSQALRFGGNLLLTKLLFPNLFGLMALVNVFITGVKMLSDIGLRQSIIQNKQGDDPNFLNTAWTMQVIRGVGLWLCCLLITLPLATFYEEPQLLWLLPVVSLNTVISGFNSTALFTFSRHMEFRKLTIFYIGVQAVSLTVMLVWAWFNHTIWALVVGGLVSALFEMVWSHRLMPEIRNRFFWEKAAAKSIFSFGKWIFLLTAVTFLAQQAPRIFLGKLPSLEMLGVYGIAFSLANVLTPLALVQGYSDAVIFPFFSKQAQLSRESLQAKIMQPRWLLLVGGAVLVTIAIGFGDLLVVTQYDKSYIQAAWILPIISLSSWPIILSQTINPILFAIGKPSYAAFGWLLKLIFIVIGLPLGFHIAGLVGFVIAEALSNLPVYGAITYGSLRERLTVTIQDIQATALLIGLVTLVLIGRVLFGVGLPVIHV
ncbi:MAG TPA: polysaccharide biosynthesis protein [Cyanobacteria bacterium UBA8543]|nr:polysaccharide biosynthesis protein [Cyanobacteria bacterium UBA8543]